MKNSWLSLILTIIPCYSFTSSHLKLFHNRKYDVSSSRDNLKQCSDSSALFDALQDIRFDKEINDSNESWDGVDYEENVTTENTRVAASRAEESLMDRVHIPRSITGVAARNGPINQEVARIAKISLEEANALIDIGAVWAKMETLTEDDILGQYDDYGSVWSGTSIEYGDLPKGWGSGQMEDETNEQDLESYVNMMQARRFRRILTPTLVERGTDIRVYPNPRRFPSCYDMTKDRLLYEDTTFIVVDKPPLLPTQPDASNYYECCPGCVNDLMGPFYTIERQKVVRPLLCHRVDSVVGGCVVLSKDTNGQKVFSQFQRDRKLKKVYLAVTNKPVPTGMHIHWMWAPQAARGKSGGPPCQLISHTHPTSRRRARQFWIRCVLEVVKSEPILIEKSNHGYDPGNQPHYQNTIRLVTGRKHQVRAQLSSLGCPIIRDTLYSPISGLTLDGLENEEGNMDDALSKCRVPTEPIGLQAHAILFGGIRAKARVPWWGDKVIR